MKKRFGAFLALCLVSAALAGCGQKAGETETQKAETQKTETQKTTKEQTEESAGDTKASSEAAGEQSAGVHHVEIEVKDYGTIKVELNGNAAPITVENFIKLAKEGFYDGLTFHRIIDGFMVQGGDPEGTGMGGSKENIKGEFEENNVKNPISHVRGTISMARSMEPDSGSSQFFIVHQDSTFLDGQYAGFGKVTEGMEIVDKICKDTPVTDDNGTVDAKNQPVIESIKVID